MKNIPGMVRPAQDLGAIIFEDKLKTLVEEARAFGRKTIEQKLATGKKLIEIKRDIDEHNKTARKDKRIRIYEFLASKGFTRTTAQRLIAAAANHDAGFKPTDEFDAMYDDGYDPVVDADKKPCRDCRLRNRKFSRKCPGCRALNRRTPKPKVEGPVVDMDGEPVPDRLVEAFKDGETIREFNSYLLSGTKSLVGLLERPGCKKINVEAIEKRLRGLYSYATKYRPGKVCTSCEGLGERADGDPCKICDGDGWVTVMAVADERAGVANAEKRRKAKEWHDRSNGRSNAPIE